MIFDSNLQENEDKKQEHFKKQYSSQNQDQEKQENQENNLNSLQSKHSSKVKEKKEYFDVVNSADKRNESAN